MEYIHSIAILDFHQKIFFFQKRPEGDFDSLLFSTKSVAKSLKGRHISEYLQSTSVIRLMDTNMLPQIKVKVSLLGEVCVIILYSTTVDIYLLNLHNMRMIDTLYVLCKTRKLKIDYLIKRYQDVNQILVDAIFFLNPRIRLSSKTEMSFAELDIQEHSIYFQIFSRAIQSLKTLVYFHSCKDYLRAKGEVLYKKNQIKKLKKGKFLLNANLTNVFLKKKNDLLKQFGALTVIENPYEVISRKRSLQSNYISKAQINNSNANSKIKTNANVKNNSKGAINTNDSTMNKSNENKLEKSTEPTSESVSPEIITQKIKNVPYESNSIIFNNEKDNSATQKNNNTEEALKSLAKVDINNLLSSINFDFDNNPVVNEGSNQAEKNSTTSIRSKIDFFNMHDNTNKKNNNNPTKQSIVSFMNFKMPDIIPSKEDNKSNSQKQQQSDTVTQSTTSNFSKSPDQNREQQQNFNINNTINENNPSTDYDIFLGSKVQSNKQLINNLNSNPQFNFNSNNNNNITNQNINFDTLHSFTMNEDIFNAKEIKRQIRLSIFERGILINNKGVYKEISYRGQLALELTSNFIIHNKSFILKLKHPNWTDQSYFPKKITNDFIIEDEPSSYKLNCREIKSMQKLLEYSPNLKIIQPAAEFQVTGIIKDEKYKLELICQMNEESYKKMRNAQMRITIITKTNDIIIHKTSNESYSIEDKKITYLIKDFTTTPKLCLGIMFKTIDPTFVQSVKVYYRYMDILPSSLEAELSYKDENGATCILDLAKKCSVEINFTP